ncbi:4'-phosphopantetheinyl transferase family protein [Paracraurococcus lichenis]|uniref:4'-phosphopantetheinyl transferase superfamily protein n=1 Tax=Paracraurococcus lichenis TaxID=3064888 RepID=A0ABT9E8Q9_9PROT|nr:4'-phosphopantetheinyl transferase superfamily protein [Paracraurococcus sp. LOR1-02]MDO9712582.1 4'-phosphopantetheinyl transferase superfamily protein [Paracraurococcus sp. LOR1-02]
MPLDADEQPAGTAAGPREGDDGVVDLWCWPTGQAGAADWDVLDQAERDRAQRFVHDRHRIAFVRAHAGLRVILGRLLGTSPRDIAFVTGPHGKPSLAVAGAPHFSLSHSGGLAAVAVATRFDLGLDIEHLRSVAVAELAAQVCSAEEARALAAVAPTHRREAFFNAWTRKEAFLKAIGAGFSLPPASFTVSLAPGEPARLLSVAGQAAEAACWQLRSFVPAVGYVGAIAARAEGWRIRNRDPQDTLP